MVKTLKKPQRTESEQVKKTKIRVVGIGGGGSSIVSEIASKMTQASFVVANTDLQALKTASRKTIRFPFGLNLTQGLGTGMSSELGLAAAQNEKDKIKKLLEGQDLCILVVSLGGGAGSGAAPVFAQVSKSLGNITYGIVTLPFRFEGEKKVEIAKAALEKIKPHLNAISVIPNERIFQIIDRATPLKQALSAINKNLTDSLAGLIETIYEPGLINIDFADLRTILEGRGRLAYLNTVVVSRSEKSPYEATEKVLSSPLYPYTIRGAKGVLLNVAGAGEINLNEVSQISKTISGLLNKEAKIIFGISQDKRYQDKIKTTLLATGCGMKFFLPAAKKKSAKRRKKKKKASIKPVLPEEPKPKPKSKPKPKPKPKNKTKTKPKKKSVSQRRKKKKAAVKKTKKKSAARRKKRTKAPIETVESPKEEKIIESRIRKNGLQIKKEAEEEEKEMLEKEKFWETPAFLRRKKFFNQ